MNIAHIRTRSGKDFDPADPKPESIDPRDIAWSLGRLPRFVGHTSAATPLSVAQHSTAVADEAHAMLGKQRPEMVTTCRLHALLHDASEAYTGDIPSPIKRLLGARILVIETKIQEAIYEAIGPRARLLAGELAMVMDTVRHADEAVLKAEMAVLLGEAPDDLIDVEPMLAEYHDLRAPLTASHATVGYYLALRQAVNAATGDDIGDLVPEGGALAPIGGAA